MRTGKIILILFLFCSLITQVIGVQDPSSCVDNAQGIHSNSSSRNETINFLNFFDENIFEELEELEEFESLNDKKAKKSFYQQLFFLGQMRFICSSKYKSQKNANKVGKYNTSNLKYMILLI